MRHRIAKILSSGTLFKSNHMPPIIPQSEISMEEQGGADLSDSSVPKNNPAEIKNTAAGNRDIQESIMPSIDKVTPVIDPMMTAQI